MRPWAGLAAVAGTRAALVEQLQRDLREAIEAPEVCRRVEPLGFEMLPSTPQELRARVAADTALYAPLVRQGRVAKM
jgi:tripartite-type tricarboxylate transporter receptor subunit TctC